MKRVSLKRTTRKISHDFYFFICLTLILLAIICNIFFYLFDISKRVLNRDTVLGNRYFVNIYIIIVKSKKLNTTWFTKKNGINWGIYLLNIKKCFPICINTPFELIYVTNILSSLIIKSLFSLNHWDNYIYLLSNLFIHII